MSTESFSTRLIRWQRVYGRHNLPWQNSGDPYRIWLSEVMLQQTQVATVIPYYERFVGRFPTVQDLAAAEQEEVMGCWSGLGYYSRARNLHKAARMVVERFGGRFPSTPEAIETLPGVGRSTAAAVAAFGFGVRAAILDGNVKRVLARHGGVDGYPGEAAVQERLWAEAGKRLPDTDIEAYTQGLMDLGNQVCVRSKPLCAFCPVSEDCVARITGRIDQLPAPRPKKALPSRRCRMVVALENGRVLVTERTGAGVWQGLLCLPQIEPDADALAFLRSHGLVAEPLAEWKPFDHVFSHYRLSIQPSLWTVTGAVAARDDGLRWLPLDRLDDAALPTPVRRLLESVRQLVV